MFHLTLQLHPALGFRPTGYGRGQRTGDASEREFILRNNGDTRIGILY